MSNFDDECEFHPIVRVDDVDDLIAVEQVILNRIRGTFHRVGRAREWFHTADRAALREMVLFAMAESGIDYEILI